MKKLERMVAVSAAAAIVGAVYSVGCVKTASDCNLLGTCTTSSASSTAGAGGATASSAASTTGEGGAAVSSSSASTSSVGGGATFGACDFGEYGNTLDQAAHRLHVDPTTGSALLAGSFLGTFTVGGKTVTATGTGTGSHVFAAKLAADAQATWAHGFPVSYGAAVDDATGDVVLAGAYDGTSAVDLGCGALDPKDNLYVVKLAAMTGLCVWSKSFTAVGAHVSLAIDKTGTIALAGDASGMMDFHTTDAGPLTVTNDSGGMRDIFVVPLDKSGNVLDAVAFGGTLDDVVNAVAFDATGGIVLAGAFQSSPLNLNYPKGQLKNDSGLNQAFAARIQGQGATWELGFPAGAGGLSEATALAIVGATPIVAGHFTSSIVVDAAHTLTAKGDDVFWLQITPGSPATVSASQAFVGAGAKTVNAISARGTDAFALAGALDGSVDFGAGALTAKQGAYLVAMPVAGGLPLWSKVFGSDATLAVNDVSFVGKTVHVAGAFTAPLDLGNGQMLTSLGATDVFTAQFCSK